MAKKVYSKEEIEQATQVDILQVAANLGFTLKKTGRTFSSGDKNQYRFYPESNSYHCFSDTLKGGGNVITFVKNHSEMKFPDIMDFLLTGEFPLAQMQEVKKENFDYFFREKEDFSKVKAYLVDERKLDAQLIDRLIERKFIRCDKYDQIVFPWNKSGLIVGASIQGTKYDPEKYGERGRFKGIARNSEHHFGFNVSIGKPDKLFVFESPIDMLSYWSLNKDIRNATFYSIDGATKFESVANFMRYSKDIKSIVYDKLYIGTDNDKAGIGFLKYFEGRFARPLVQNIIPDYYKVPQADYKQIKGLLAEKHSVLDWRLVAAVAKEGLFSLSKEEYPAGLSNLVEKLDAVGGDLDKYFEENQLPLVEKELIERTFQEYLAQENPMKHQVVKDWNEFLQNGEMLSDQHVERTFEEKQGWKQDYESKQDSLSVKAEEVNGKVFAKLYQSGAFAGAFEADSPKEMDELIQSYGFVAIDKEDVKKYGKQSKEMKKAKTTAKVEFSM